MEQKQKYIDQKTIKLRTGIELVCLTFILTVALVIGGFHFYVKPSYDVLIEYRTLETMAASNGGVRKMQLSSEGETLSNKGTAQNGTTVNASNIEQLITETFPQDQHANAIAIMRCESSGNIKAVGDKHLTPSSYGLFQIRAFDTRPTPEALFNPYINVKTAYKIWQKSGWTPWYNCARKNGLV